MSKIYLGIGLALVLAIPAAASAATVPVTSLSGDFAATNSTVTLTTDGVHFGTYGDATAIGGSLFYNGFNGRPLGDLTELNYVFTYRAGSETGLDTAAPYLRVFTDANGNHVFDGADNSVILDPSYCATVDNDQATLLTYDMVGDSVRYNDDGCDGVPPDNQPWDDVITAHGTEEVIGIAVTQGFAATGTDVSALLTELSVNGTVFDFGAPQSGPAGPAGPAGGTVTIVQQPTQLTQTTVASSRLVGNTLRVLHAPKRKGERLLSVRAWLLTPTGTKRLPVDGMAIKVDLRPKPVGNYNVILKSKYRRKDGTVHTVRTTRNLSVTVA
jgi:hypothetical protein